MPETGILLKDHVLLLVAWVDLILTIVGGALIVAGIATMAKSLDRRCKNRVEQLSQRLKAIGFIKLWALLFANSSVLGVIIGFLSGSKVFLYGNFVVGVLFLIFFIMIKRTHQLVSKELESVKAILSS